MWLRVVICRVCEVEKGRWVRWICDVGVEEDRGCVILKVNKKDDGVFFVGISFL